MFKRIGSAVVLVATLLLGACVGPVPKIDAPLERLVEIKSIAVVKVPEPKTYTVFNMGHPGMAFGLIGGLVAAADQSSKQDTLSAAYKAQGTAINTLLVKQLATRLEAQGYAVTEQDAPWVEANGGYTLAFDKLESPADAILVVSPTMVGFVSPPRVGVYLPTITSVVVLLGKDKTKPIYRGYHSAGWKPLADGWRNTEAKTTFPDFAALMADTKASASRLEKSASDIADSVAQDLKRVQKTAAAP